MSKTDEYGSLMSRNTPVVTSLKGRDVYKQWMISKGASATAGRTLRAIEKSFFAANGGSGKTYTELKGSFLSARGYTGKSLEENWRRFLAGGSV